MKNQTGNSKSWKAVLLALALPMMFSHSLVYATQGVGNINKTLQQKPKIISARKINPTSVEVLLSNNQRMTFDFYGENVFRLFQDNSGGIIRDPEAKPEAKILVNNPRKSLSVVNVSDDENSISIVTEKIKIQLDKNSSLLKVINLNTNVVVLEEAEPIRFEKNLWWRCPKWTFLS